MRPAVSTVLCKVWYVRARDQPAHARSDRGDHWPIEA